MYIIIIYIQTYMEVSPQTQSGKLYSTLTLNMFRCSIVNMGKWHCVFGEGGVGEGVSEGVTDLQWMIMWVSDFHEWIGEWSRVNRWVSQEVISSERVSEWVSEWAREWMCTQPSSTNFIPMMFICCCIYWGVGSFYPWSQNDRVTWYNTWKEHTQRQCD